MSSENEKPGASATELGELLVGASRVFAQRGRARFEAHGLFPAQVRLLVTLRKASGIRMRDLADLLGVTGRAVTPLVDALEADGLVARQPDPADRRAFRITLTDTGLAAVDQIEDLQHAVSGDIFSVLAEEERHRLAHLLHAFLARTAARSEQHCPLDASPPGAC